MSLQNLQLNVGSTWDLKQLDLINSLNIKHGRKEARVTEVYGSLGFLPTARSYDRLPTRTIEQLVEYVDRAGSYGIDVKWTMNASCLGSTSSDSFGLCREWAYILKGCGVNKFIVTIPLVIEIIKSANPEAEVEVSTISRITSIKEIDEYCEMGVNGICWDVMENRNIRLLRQAIERAHKREMFIEVIVNEFCVFMCIHRNVCYNLSSHNSGREAYEGYPFSRCIHIRAMYPWQWVATRFVLPSWLRYYRDLGVDKFKITGRTHPTDEVIRVLEYYMGEVNPDNLLDLWHHINILVADPHNPSKELSISTERLEESGFLQHFVNNGQECRYRSCWECGYCKSVYEKIRR